MVVPQPLRFSQLTDQPAIDDDDDDDEDDIGGEKTRRHSSPSFPFIPTPPILPTAKVSTGEGERGKRKDIRGMKGGVVFT